MKQTTFPIGPLRRELDALIVATQAELGLGAAPNAVTEVVVARHYELILRSMIEGLTLQVLADDLKRAGALLH